MGKVRVADVEMEAVISRSYAFPRGVWLFAGWLQALPTCPCGAPAPTPALEGCPQLRYFLD